MCTILTSDRDTFFNNLDDMVDTIKQNQWFNDHGNALIVKGWNSEDLTILKTMSLEAVLAVLQTDSSWERFWLHQRMATTTATTIEQCHAFSAHPWYVMHNGILHSMGADLQDVDSRFIAEVIKSKGVDYALYYLNSEESYANVFLVNVETGDFIVSRQHHGHLYTSPDGLVFSTTMMQAAYIPVPQNSEYRLGMYEPKIKKKAATPATVKFITGTTVRPSHLKYFDFSFEEAKFKFYTELEAADYYDHNGFYPDELTDEIYQSATQFNMRNIDTRETAAELSKGLA